MSEEKIGMYSTKEIYEELATGFLHHSMVDAMYFKIKDLQQKVKQLEKEVNKYQKELEKADSITQSCIFQGKQESKISFRKCLNRLEQLENIRKEAIEYINHEIFKRTILVGVGTKKYTRNILDNILNILNKGDNKDVKKNNTHSN